ncbi:Hypothetical protein A7982_05494 [Minicystis rosea]|nr:Hypothetical protein A7982_05494 [Minicystis rosea]
MPNSGTRRVFPLLGAVPGLPHRTKTYGCSSSMCTSRTSRHFAAAFAAVDFMLFVRIAGLYVEEVRRRGAHALTDGRPASHQSGGAVGV